MVNRAARLRLVRHQPVAVIQEQHSELLDLLAGQHCVQIGHQPVPVVQHRAIEHLRPRQPQCPRLDQLQRRHAGFAQPLHPAQILHRGRDRTGKTTEAIQQQPGDRLGVAPRQRQEQDHLQHLVIRQRVRPGRQQPLPHARPVPIDTQRRRLQSMRFRRRRKQLQQPKSFGKPGRGAFCLRHTLAGCHNL